MQGGDEYYNFLHGEYGSIIVFDKITGYYCYAQIANSEITATLELNVELVHNSKF